MCSGFFHINDNNHLLRLIINSIFAITIGYCKMSKKKEKKSKKIKSECCEKHLRKNKMCKSCPLRLNSEFGI